MTFALLASSLTMTLAAQAESRGRRLVWLAATFGLGVAFVVGAGLEYAHLVGEGMRFSSGIYASTFYALTGYHGLHVVVGLVALLFVARRAATGRTLEVMALYWHFVDLAWMPIFTFLYLVPPR
jgi:heme/copper-type cytochrome/quinol oxidase subunit 3